MMGEACRSSGRNHVHLSDAPLLYSQAATGYGNAAVKSRTPLEEGSPSHDEHARLDEE